MRFWVKKKTPSRTTPRFWSIFPLPNWVFLVPGLFDPVSPNPKPTVDCRPCSQVSQGSAMITLRPPPKRFGGLGSSLASGSCFGTDSAVLGVGEKKPKNQYCTFFGCSGLWSFDELFLFSNHLMEEGHSWHLGGTTRCTKRKHKVHIRDVT